MSNKVIGPDTWGPVIWHALHYITLGYPDQPSNHNKEKYKQFFTLISDVLPCSICADHYSENLLKMPLDDIVLANKESLIKWLIDVHNVVNEKNKKPIIKYEVARKMIEENTECKHNIIYEPIVISENEKTIIKDEENGISESTNIKKNKVVKSNNNFFNIYYLFALLLLIILISFIMKKRV